MTLKVSIREFFTKANASNMRTCVEEFYAENAHFEDPMVSIDGRAALISYYGRLYENVISIHFEVHTEISSGNQTCAQWRMTLRHKRLAGGRDITLDGVSWVRANAAGQAEWHRDWFDLTAMLHDNIPIVGILTKLVRRIAAGSH
jgi:limonene-1,2-epoxide hydrolase